VVLASRLIFPKPQMETEAAGHEVEAANEQGEMAKAA
jgi:hypothetical protein